MTALLALRIPVTTTGAAASTQLLQFRDRNGSFETLTTVQMLAGHRSRPSLSFFSNSHYHRFSSMLSSLGQWSGTFATMVIIPSSFPWIVQSCWRRRHSWSIAFALNTGGTSDGGSQDNLNSDSGGFGQTRLGRIVGAGGKQLLEKLNAARKNFPMKIFLLLLGFYTANALATILGQTGDWDVLVAGVVVAAIEGIGMLMYRKPPPLLIGRFQSLVGMVNYWKAGVCLGLFVDAFKLGS